MGKPLRADFLANLKLKVAITGSANKTLVKQVGFNKYLAKPTAASTETATVVTLVDKTASELAEGEGLLVLTDNSNTYNVIKVTKNLMYTAKDEDATYAYSYVDGAIKFAKTGVSVATEQAAAQASAEKASEK